MTKIFVLDTSAILASGGKVFSRFGNHEVVIPLVVIKELEKKRNDPELGLTARSALNCLEDLRSEGHSLSEAITINDEGGTLRIELNHISQSHLPESLVNDRSSDTRILAVASSIQKESPEKEVVLISKDLPMRIIASTVLHIEAEDLRLNYTPMSSLGGINYIDTSDSVVDSLFSSDKGVRVDGLESFPVNSKVVLRGSTKSSSALAYVDSSKRLRRANSSQDAGPVQAKSVEQQFAIHDLYDPSIKIVSMGGKAGSGKSLLSIVAGLDQVLDKSTPYQKVTIFRPVNTLVGQELGFLPGEVGDKMEPYAQAVYDTLESVYLKEKINLYKRQNLIEVQPLTYIRGRTLDKSWVVVDEAQNLEKYILLTAMTRIGHDSKIVLDWDVSQRDNLHVGKHDGIWEVVQRLLGNPLFSHTSLLRSERSDVAELVSEVLDEYI